MGTGKIDDVFEENFMTSAKFSLEIERIVKESKLNYIEAVVQFCEDKNIELETVNKLVSKPLKEKLKYDAQRLNFMKKTSRGYLSL
jgi:KaiC/GvpD/RAD55 family RecA-like ATPase